MWPFGKSLVQQGHEALDRVEKRIDGLIKSEQSARTELAQTIVQLNSANAELAKLKTKLREQTEADLYLLSAKIMRDIMDKGSAQPEDVQRQATLQMQMASYGQAANHYAGAYGYGGQGMGLLGAIGLRYPN